MFGFDVPMPQQWKLDSGDSRQCKLAIRERSCAIELDFEHFGNHEKRERDESRKLGAVLQPNQLDCVHAKIHCAIGVIHCAIGKWLRFAPIGFSLFSFFSWFLKKCEGELT